MVVTKVNESNNLTIKLNGRLDSSSSYLLDEEISLVPTTCEKLILDLKDLELVLEVFEITGFDAILNIKR